MYAAFRSAPALPSVELNYPTFASTPLLPPQTFEETKPEKIFTCCVRNKVGLDDDADAAPVRLVNINEEELVKMFHLPLSAACREAGLCSTTFKKACRYHGLRKWPYRRPHRNGERKEGERGVGLDATNTTCPFFLLEEDFNTASRPNSATALSSGVFSALSKPAPTAQSSSNNDSDGYDAHFWAQPVGAYTQPSQWGQPSPLSGMGGLVATHHMPPALHDDVPFGLTMAPVPRRMDRTTRVGAAAGLLEPAPGRIDHTASAACWTPSAASHDVLMAISTASRSRDALWTTGAAAQDGISWATWGMQRALPASTVPLGAPEGTLVDAVEACLALPLDGAFIRDFCRQD